MLKSNVTNLETLCFFTVKIRLVITVQLMSLSDFVILSGNGNRVVILTTEWGEMVGSLVC